MNKKIEMAIREEITFLPKEEQDIFLDGFQEGVKQGGLMNKIAVVVCGFLPQSTLNRLMAKTIEPYKIQLMFSFALGKTSEELID